MGLLGGLLLAEIFLGSFSKDFNRNYSALKASDWFLALEFDRRVRNDGILCVAQSPGLLKTKG
jgi:hypothetical protein